MAGQHPWIIFDGTNFSFFTPAPAACTTTTVTLTADADSWMDQNSASNNFGSGSILKVQAKLGNNFRALVRFPVPASMPQGCVVQSATLRLYATSSTSSRTLQAIRVVAGWAENSITWDKQPQTTGDAAETSSGSGYLEWDVGALVQAEYDVGANNGFLIRDASEDGGSEQQFHSREKGESMPQLIITFAAPGG